MDLQPQTNLNIDWIQIIICILSGFRAVINSKIHDKKIVGGLRNICINKNFIIMSNIVSVLDGN